MQLSTQASRHTTMKEIDAVAYCARITANCCVRTGGNLHLLFNKVENANVARVVPVPMSALDAFYILWGMMK